MFQNRRSLTITSSHSARPTHMNMIAAPIQSLNTFGTINTTNLYNEQYDTISRALNERRQELQDKVSSLGYGDTSLRNEGVNLAWKYEQAEIQMGGKGSGNWDQSQRHEILENGRVRGAEGHHINSVKEHPGEQANPDNIKFTKNRQDHLNEHHGDFRNPTEGDLIDRNKRLEDINNKRVLKNELKGIGLAAAIGLGVGFTIGVAVTLAQKGVSVESVKAAVSAGMKNGLEASSLAVVNHLVVRGIGEIATNALVQSANVLGFEITENVLKMCNMAVVGAISSIVFSSWVFIKLKWKGYSTSSAAIQASKTLGKSLGILFISIVAQGIWGGYAGLIASLSVGLILVGIQYLKNQMNINLIESIHIYTIDKLRPNF